MATSTKKDMYKYKQHPYFEKPKGKERRSIAKAFRHFAKIHMMKVEEELDN